MKKLFLIVMFAGSFQTAYAQMSEGEKTSGCSQQAINSLSSCLSSKGISYKMTNVGNSTLHITAQGNPPAGHIQSCIAHYNQVRKTCPQAPEVVYIKNNNGKKDD